MKRAGKIVILGACIGIVLLIIQRSLAIDMDTFNKGYWLAAPFIILGVVLINLFYNMYYMKKTQQYARLLQAGKPQEYIAGMEGLLKTAKGKNLRSILTLNLSAGYVELKQFDKAIAILEGLSAQDLKGSAINVVHRINLCMSYFETEQYKKAIALYRESEPLLNKYRSGQSYGGYIALLDMLAAAYEKDYQRAEELRQKALQTYPDPRVQKALQEMGEKLKEKKGSQTK